MARVLLITLIVAAAVVAVTADTKSRLARKGVFLETKEIPHPACVAASGDCPKFPGFEGPNSRDAPPAQKSKLVAANVPKPKIDVGVAEALNKAELVEANAKPGETLQQEISEAAGKPMLDNFKQAPAQPSTFPGLPANQQGLPPPRTPEEAALRTEVAKLERKENDLEASLQGAKETVKEEANELEYGSPQPNGEMPNVEKTMEPVTRWVDEWMKKANLFMADGSLATPGDEAHIAVEPIIERIENEEALAQEDLKEKHEQVIKEVSLAEKSRVAAEFEAKKKANEAKEASLDQAEEKEDQADNAAAMAGSDPCCKELEEEKRKLATDKIYAPLPDSVGGNDPESDSQSITEGEGAAEGGL